MTEPLALLAACAHEAALIHKLLRVQHQTTSPVGRLWHGTLSGCEVLLVQCGMGPERATQAASWLATHYPLRALMTLGFAGGLDADLVSGAALLVTTVHGATPDTTPPDAIRPDARLSHIAAMALAQAALVGYTGSLISVPELMPQATTKQHLGQQTGALAVDMESYSLGQSAQQYQLPFAALRIILDPVTEDLTFPVRYCMTPTGDLRAAPLAVYLARHPRLCTHLPHWWWQAQQTGRHLQRWVQHFFILLSQGA